MLNSVGEYVSKCSEECGDAAGLERRRNYRAGQRVWTAQMVWQRLDKGRVRRVAKVATARRVSSDNNSI